LSEGLVDLMALPRWMCKKEIPGGRDRNQGHELLDGREAGAVGVK
jgi:hypothetical protein